MEIKNLFRNSLILRILNKDKYIANIDIIHNKKIYFNKSCSEYLSLKMNDTIIVPIPIKYCFSSIKSYSLKKNEIKNYINYINKETLFNYKILNEKDSEKVYKRYFNRSLMNNISLRKEFIINNINTNIIYNIKIPNNKIEDFRNHIINVIKLKYPNFIINNTNDNYNTLIINNLINISRKVWSRENSPFYLIKKNKIKKINNLNIFNIKSNNIFSNYLNINDFNLDMEYIIRLKLNTNLNNLEINKLIVTILKEKVCFIINNNINNSNSNNTILNSIKAFSILENILNKEYVFSKKNIMTKLFNKFKNNFIFIKINGSDLKMNNSHRLLIHLTILRYMFYHKVNHISKIIMIFKEYCNLDVIHNLIISSHLHNNTAWDRYNLVKSRSSYDLYEKNYSQMSFFKVNDKVVNDIKLKLKSRSITKINNIFSNNLNEIKLSIKQKEDFYKDMIKLYNNKKYTKLIKKFK